MQNTGRNGKNSNYLVILLLFVGLTAFSNSMKELAQIHQFTLDTGRLIASWSDSAVPAAIPPVMAKVERTESCQSQQSLPALELPWLKTEPSAVAPARSAQLRTQKVTRPFAIDFNAAQLARLKNLGHFEINPEQFEIPVVDNNLDANESMAIPIATTMLRAKARKHNVIKLSPRDRDIFLKTLNRSINLRIAS